MTPFHGDPNPKPDDPKPEDPKPADPNAPSA